MPHFEISKSHRFLAVVSCNFTSLAGTEIVSSCRAIDEPIPGKKADCEKPATRLRPMPTTWIRNARCQQTCNRRSSCLLYCIWPAFWKAAPSSSVETTMHRLLYTPPMLHSFHTPLQTCQPTLVSEVSNTGSRNPLLDLEASKQSSGGSGRSAEVCPGCASAQRARNQLDSAPSANTTSACPSI